jgi:arylsulfatase
MIWLLLACSGEPGTPTPVEAPEQPGPRSPGGQAPGKQGPHGQPSHPPPPGGHPGPPPNMEPFHATPTFQLTEPSSGPHPSILVISLDTVRADSLALYGGPAEMPAVEAVAERGVVFDQAITHFPQTCLSHWSMMSGVMPELHGNTPGTRGSLYSGPTLAEIARGQGYATGAFIGGQTLQDKVCGLSRGFTVYDDEFSFDFTDMRRHGREVVGAASAWVSQQEGPWFAFVHLFDAHFPYTPSDPRRFDPDYSGSLSGSDADLRPYRDGQPLADREVQHVRALYDAEVEELDALLSPLLAQVGEDVIVVITADHGESFEHAYLFNHKDRLYEGILHIPLVISGPGVEAGRRTAQFGLIDLAPTLLQLAGLPLDERMQGRPWAERETVYSITDPWEPGGAELFSARSLSAKRIEGPEGASCFDLGQDPGERAPSPCPSDRAAYQAEIQALLEHQVRPSGPTAPVSAEDCRQLEALGYMKCEPGQ